MNVDYGLVSMFAIQLAIVLATYHAWRGIKAEISALESLRAGNAAVTSRVDALSAKMDTQAERISSLDAAPKATKARIEELEALCGKVDRRVEALDGKIVSVSARVSAYAKHRKAAVEDEEETDPAPQGEGDTIPDGMMPPGSIPLSRQSTQSTVPPGFGVVGGRRVKYG